MSSARKISPYSTNQGNEGTCWAHSTTRLISRLIKSLRVEPVDKYPDEFHDTIIFEEGEILEEYYDTINCSSEHTIFHCIAHAQDIHERKGKPFSMHKSLNKVIKWESENLSAMLFHFIFNSIKNKFLCEDNDNLPRRAEAAPIFYFLKLLRKGITEEKIKVILKYNDYVTQLEEYFTLADEHLHELREWSEGRAVSGKDSSGKDSSGEDSRGEDSSSEDSSSEAAEEGNIEVAQYRIDHYYKIKANITQFKQEMVMFSRLITKLASLFELFRISLKKKTLKIDLYMSTNLNDFIQINDKLGFRDHGWLVDTKNKDKKNSIIHKGYTSITTIYRTLTWIEPITQILERGLYVLLSIYRHAILITAIEGEFFIVKNSWGTSRNWTLPSDEQFIVDNKLSISTLIEHSRYTRVVLVFIVLERFEDEIFTEEKLPNKSIIHTLKKTAKRLSACFGMGKKNKTQNKFKKYHKKISKMTKSSKNV